jgi:hypothetical protein
MIKTENLAFGKAIPAQARGVRSTTSARPADFVKDLVGLPETSRPAGSVALDFGCDLHNGRLMRLWMSFQAECTTFGGEGRKGAWDTDTNDQGAIVVKCTRPGCQNSARLTSDWLVASLGKVRTDFASGRGLPIAWFPLSKVGAPSR